MLSNCAHRSIERSKNVTYTQDDKFHENVRTLNIFAPSKRVRACNVFIFVHGGSWNSGKKSHYNFLGGRMARKNVVTVIINYPLSPQARFNEMATAVAKSVFWVKENIGQYGGDSDAIFLSGHSAGGHLAALVSLQDEYFDSLNIPNPIKGAILIDAAGLDMYGYLSEEKFQDDHSYLKTFTKNPREWKKASPLYHLHRDMPELLIYRGQKTYPSIVKSHDKFVAALREYNPSPRYYVLKNKKHVGMITQFFRTKNPPFKEIIAFMDEH